MAAVRTRWPPNSKWHAEATTPSSPRLASRHLVSQRTLPATSVHPRSLAAHPLADSPLQRAALQPSCPRHEKQRSTDPGRGLNQRSYPLTRLRVVGPDRFQDGPRILEDEVEPSEMIRSNRFDPADCGPRNQKGGPRDGHLDTVRFEDDPPRLRADLEPRHAQCEQREGQEQAVRHANEAERRDHRGERAADLDRNRALDHHHPDRRSEPNARERLEALLSSARSALQLQRREEIERCREGDCLERQGGSQPLRRDAHGQRQQDASQRNEQDQQVSAKRLPVPASWRTRFRRIGHPKTVNPNSDRNESCAVLGRAPTNHPWRRANRQTPASHVARESALVSPPFNQVWIEPWPAGRPGSARRTASTSIS